MGRNKWLQVLTKKWQKKEWRRNEIIRQAIHAAALIILRASGDDEEKKNYLTAMVAEGLMQDAFRPLKDTMLRKDLGIGKYQKERRGKQCK